MKPTTELIAAFRTVRERIEGGDWNWGAPSFCNCGLLLRELVGDEHALTLALLLGEHQAGPWSSLPEAIALSRRWSEDRCGVTGLPFEEVLTRLEGYGLTAEDMAEIEGAGILTYRDGRFISLELGIEGCDVVHPANYMSRRGEAIARWFGCKADALEMELREQEASAVPQAQSQPVARC